MRGRADSHVRRARRGRSCLTARILGLTVSLALLLTLVGSTTDASQATSRSGTGSSHSAGGASEASVILNTPSRANQFLLNDFSRLEAPLAHESLTLAVEVSEAVGETSAEVELGLQLAKLFQKGRGAAIAIELESGEAVIEYRPDEVFTAASVYKLFTAYSILKRIDAGTLEGSSLINGVSAGECVERMILWSDNECPQAWIDHIGFPEMQRIARSTGATSTSFKPFDIRTTPRDAADFLAQLYNGELLGRQSTADLIDLMKSQVWRERIPAALEPKQIVANKPGFLDEYSHDAAIIYTQKGDYVLVIFTAHLGDRAVQRAAELIFDRL